MRTLTNLDRYIFPPRADLAVPREATAVYARRGWLGQLKYNDSHVLIKYLPANNANHVPFELWNRHGDKLRDYRPPQELTEQINALHHLLGLDPHKMSILDGGVLDRKHAAIKDSIVIWDILVRDNEHLLDTTYQERYDFLLSRTHASSTPWMFSRTWKGETTAWDLGLCLTSAIFMPQIITPDKWDETWDMITDINRPYTEKNGICRSPVIEGLVFKLPSGQLQAGYSEKNNSDWISRSRVWTGRHRY